MEVQARLRSIRAMLVDSGTAVSIRMSSSRVAACTDMPSCWSEVADRFSGYAQVSPCATAEATVFFTGDVVVHDWLRDLLHAADDGRGTGGWAAIAGDPTLAIARHDDEDDCTVTSYVLVDRAGALLIAYPSSGGPPCGRMHFRQLRARLVYEHARAHWRFLHASAAVHQGRGVVVVGDKFAGKTSTLLWLLSGGGFDLVANDLVAVRWLHARWEITGFPITAGVRAGTLACFPQLAEACRDVIGDGLRTALADPAPALRWLDRKILLAPQRLAGHFATGIRIDVPLSLVLAPVYDATVTRARLERASPAQAIALLRHCSLTSLSAILPLQRFLAALTPAPAMHAARVMARLARTVPCYRLVQNERTGSQTCALVRAACSGGAQRHAADVS